MQRRAPESQVSAARWGRSAAVAAMATLLAALAACSQPGPAPGPDLPPDPTRLARRPALVISAFYVTTLIKGGPDKAFTIANVGDVPVDIADYSLSDILGPSGGYRYVNRGRGLRRDVVFPQGTAATVIPPGGELVVARDATAYFDQYGVFPDFEFGPDPEFPANDMTVPDVYPVVSAAVQRAAKSLWPTWPAHGADVAGLFMPPEPNGSTLLVDAVAWDFSRKKRSVALLTKLREYEHLHGLPEGTYWTGPALDPWGELASPYSPTGRVFVRDRDVAGRILPSTNSFRDWNSGASVQRLGEDPTHRIMMPGQSRFLPHTSTERALITATAAPDNNYRALVAAFDAAERDIKVRVYYFAHLPLFAALLRAVQRGVDVTLYLEGTRVATRHGFPDLQRYIAQQIEYAGRERTGNPDHGLGRAYWMRSDRARAIGDRYWFDHSKYAIIDGRTVIIGSENYGLTGHPVDPSFGNRGWQIHIATPPGAPPLEIVRALEAVWADDLDPENHRDIIRFSDAADTRDADGRGRYGPPPRDFVPPADPPQQGSYVPLLEPATFDEEATFELVLSPDTSLNEETGILGAIAAAEEEILVQYLSVSLYWGSRIKTIPRSTETTPSLFLEALLAAARRGVRVRVMVDCTRHLCNPGPEDRDPRRDNNDDVVQYLREVAAAENLDLEAQGADTYGADHHRLEDRESLGFDKIHNKGMIIDRRRTLVSSINGSENSFKGNREVAVIVTSTPVAAYYAHLFWHDWTTIAAPTAVATEVSRRPAATYCSPDSTRTGVLVTGLVPRQTYYVRVTALDSDITNFDRIDWSRRIGPHESAFSDEIVVQTTRTGTVELRWDVNQSESLEGDLAGYHIYFDLSSGARFSTPGDALRAGHYGAVTTGSAPSPLRVMGGCPLPPPPPLGPGAGP